MRDPVHDYIDIPNPLLPLVRCKPVQRLRDIAQNSRAVAAYPSMNGSRYEHALGTMHLARQAWRFAWANTFPVPGNGLRSELQDKFALSIFQELLSTDLQELDQYTARLIGDVAADLDKRKSGFFQEFETTISLVVGAVGLLHDVGHPPFSHVLENLYVDHCADLLGNGAVKEWQHYKESVSKFHEPQFHEWAGLKIAKQLPDVVFQHLPRYLIERVLAARSGGEDWANCLHALIDGQFDVDRLDYLQRDARRAGSGYDAIDSARLLKSLELHQRDGGQGWVIGLGIRAVSSLETMLLLRAQSYRWVIHHPSITLADTALARLCESIFQLMTADPGSDEDRRLLTSLRSLQPGLDYIASLKAPECPSVDDHLAFSWLRSVRLLLNRSSYLSKHLRQRTEICEALFRCFDDLSTHYVPAWRNYGDYLFHAERNEHAIALRNSEMSDESIPNEPVNGNGIGSTSEKVTRAFEQTWPALLNSALDWVTSRNEQKLEELLNSEYETILGLGEGYWVVARKDFRAIRAGATNVFRKGEAIDISHLSPIVPALVAAELMRPRWFAYFLPLTTDQDERQLFTKHGRAVADAFFAAAYDLAPLSSSKIAQDKEG